MSDKIADYSPEVTQTESPFFTSAYAPDTNIKAGGKFQFTVSDSSFLPAVTIDQANSGTANSGTEAKHEPSGDVKRPAAVAAAQPVAEETDFFDGCWNVVSDLAEGAYEDIVEHPLETVAKIVVGVGVGVAAAFVAPVVLAGAAVGATIGMGYEAYEHGGEWCDSIAKVANPEGYSAAEVEEAHKAVKGMGAVVADVALGAVTGVAGSALAGVVSSAVRGATSAEVSSVVAGGVRGASEGDVSAAVEAGAARGVAADSAAGNSAAGNSAAASPHFPTEPPAGGKYIEIKVPNDDVIDPNLPLLEREMEELWGPQVSMALEEGRGARRANGGR